MFFAIESYGKNLVFLILAHNYKLLGVFSPIVVCVCVCIKTLSSVRAHMELILP